MIRRKITVGLMWAMMGLLLALTACGAYDRDVGEAEVLVGTEWTLQSIRGEDLLAGVNITANFTEGEEGKQVVGSAGCNDYSASYDRDGEEITVEEYAVTEMFCQEPEGVMEEEQAYLETLLDAARYEAPVNTLTIYNAAGEQILRFTDETIIE